jgi:hypothetical protein
MRTLRTSSGELAIIFSEEEISQIVLSVGKIAETSSNDPFKGMHSNHREFYKELLTIHGKGKKINRRDQSVKQLQRKYYITDVAGSLRLLEKKGFCEVFKNENGTIGSFLIKNI